MQFIVIIWWYSKARPVSILSFLCSAIYKMDNSNNHVYIVCTKFSNIAYMFCIGVGTAPQYFTLETLLIFILQRRSPHRSVYYVWPPQNGIASYAYVLG